MAFDVAMCDRGGERAAGRAAGRAVGRPGGRAGGRARWRAGSGRYCAFAAFCVAWRRITLSPPLTMRTNQFVLRKFIITLPSM